MDAEQVVQVLVPISDTEQLQTVENFALTLTERFGQIKANLYSTSAPVDENVLAERVSAIDNLLDNLVLTLDMKLNGTPHHPATFIN